MGESGLGLRKTLIRDGLPQFLFLAFCPFEPHSHQALVLLSNKAVGKANHMRYKQKFKSFSATR